MSQAFYRKWRPQKWDQVIAQEHVVQTLRNAVRTARFAHAYLLAGPRGTGKTTTARLLAKALNCLAEDPAARPCDECLHCKAINEGRFLDLIEIDAASNTSVDDVRDLREKINFSPSQGRYKIYIIDEVHMLSTAAFNALLKTLEEPPPHAIFILATTEVHKIPATILSRVQRYEFRRIPVEEIRKHLRHMADEEQLQVDDDALLLIARQATGAMRDAISLLDQLTSSGERVTLAAAQTVLGTAASRLVIDLVEALLAKDPAAGMRQVQTALDGGSDARQFARQVVEYLRGVLLVKMGNAEQVDATRETLQEMAGCAARFDAPQLLAAIRAFNAAAVDSRSGWHPGLALELAVAECVTLPAPLPAPLAQPAAAQSAPPAPKEAPEPKAASMPPPLARYQKNEPPADEPITPEERRAAPADRAPKPARAQTPPAPHEPDPPAAEPPPAGPPGELTFQSLQTHWNRIREFVKRRNSLTEAALNSARFSLRDNATLLLTFQSEVVKSKMETAENLKILSEALQAILNARPAIRCVVSGARPDAKSGDLGIEGDGIVGAALDLGAQITHEE